MYLYIVRLIISLAFGKGPETEDVCIYNMK